MFFTALAIALLMRPGALRAAPAAEATSAAGFRAFLEKLWPEASAAGVSRATFEQAFAGVTPDPALLRRPARQAEFVRPMRAYLADAVNARRIVRGQEEAQRWREALARAGASGVEPAVVIAIWGMETNYGAQAGGQPVVRTLATLAMSGPRAGFFRAELIDALRILEEGHVAVEALRGSWAGAMGQTQFMPSSFRRYAVDGDGDGRKDIWASADDAIASTANYLKQNGWTAGERWGEEVALPAGFTPAPDDHAVYQPLRRWRERGLRRAAGGELPARGEAKLLLPAGLSGPAFLLGPNFYVIKTYNNSFSYALAVALLADRIAGAGPVVGRWPPDVVLTGAQMRELQDHLGRLGHDPGERDGKLGEKVRHALARWQAGAGLVPDGHPTPALLGRLRRTR
jgi:lytic murein transglycosylase